MASSALSKFSAIDPQPAMRIIYLSKLTEHIIWHLKDEHATR
jgi:hypothetical protein